MLASGVGQQDRRSHAGVEAVELALLVAAGVASEHQRVRLCGDERSDPYGFGETCELPGLCRGRRDLMELNHVAGTPGNDQLALLRMPVDGEGRLELRIRRDFRGQRRGDRRNPVGLQIGIGGDDLGGEHRGHHHERGDRQDDDRNAAHGAAPLLK